MGELAWLVADAAAQHRHRRALLIGGRSYTYGWLEAQARQLAGAIERADDAGTCPLVLVWASRTVQAYVGVLAALFARRGYVPVSPDLPDQRMAAIIGSTGSTVMTAGRDELPEVAGRAASWPHSVRLLPMGGDAGAVVGSGPADDVCGQPFDLADVAYLLFTSGTTGAPKGVPVLHENAVPLIAYMTDHYAIGPDDVCTQNFELTFDLSVHSIFTAWTSGATLAVPARNEAIAPGRFITDNGVTMWYSVPSVTGFMRRLGQLRSAAFPGLRAVLFCGEALPTTAAQAWAAAAPNAVVDNHYGPTEAAMSVTGYRWDEGAAQHPVVPIGYPYPGVALRVVDGDGADVAPGERGELLIGGRQVVPGYWRDPDRSAGSFRQSPTGRFYRSGDRVIRPARDGDPYVYVDRLDNQVKILGHRIELGDVEAAARDVVGHEAVVAVARPAAEAGHTSLELFVGHGQVDPAAVLDGLRERLPAYMLPRHVHVLDTLPLNANGKYDRRAMQALLEG